MVDLGFFVVVPHKMVVISSPLVRNIQSMQPSTALCALNIATYTIEAVSTGMLTAVVSPAP